MHFSFFHLLSLTSFFLSTFALPLVERADPGITALSQLDVSQYDPYTYFASSAYCKLSSLKSWQCQACKKIPGFKLFGSGGNGATVQQWYVGYWPAKASIVVVYQGTVPGKVIPLLTDANMIFTTPDPKLFKGIPAGAKVHDGFKSAFGRSQNDVLTAVKRASVAQKTKKVTVIGHSLGGAIATLSAASMRSLLGPSWYFKVVTYGGPRVGNAEWVRYVDERLPDFSRIVNKRDPIPTVPGQSFKYVANKGEIHITDDGKWNKCPGNDNPSPMCTKNAISTRFKSSVADHSGPYNGIMMGMC